MSPPRWIRRARALAAAALLSAASEPARAGDLSTALPHTFWLRAPRGPASARDVDAAGTRHAASLPSPAGARVAFRHRLPTGASGNVLVDAAGALFIPGSGRVTELAADGSLRHAPEAPLSGSVAAALLGDGTRAVLTREGRLLGWSAAGAVVFDTALPTLPPLSGGALVPLPDGGLLASVGRWVFTFDASRGAPLVASLPAALGLARQVGARTLLIDERGRVFEWRGAEPLYAGELSAPAVAALGDGSALIALTSARTLESLDPSTGQRRTLQRVDAPGPLPVLALWEPESWLTLGQDGDWMRLGASALAPGRGPPRREGRAVRDPHLLSGEGGLMIAWAANRPLVLGDAAGASRELDEVRCPDPLALAPAGAGRAVAVCGSGSLWLIEDADARQAVRPGDPEAPRSHWHPRPGRPILPLSLALEARKLSEK